MDLNLYDWNNDSDCIRTYFAFQQPFIQDIEENDLFFSTIVILWLIFIEIFGNLSLLATFAYEKYGMDPKKRTVINQLLSQITFVIIAINIICLPILTWRRLISVLYPIFATFLQRFFTFSFIMISLTFSEMLMFKVMYIRISYWIASRDENFLSLFCFCFNLLISLLILLQNILLSDTTCNFYYQRFTNEMDVTLDSNVCVMSHKV